MRSLVLCLVLVLAPSLVGAQGSPRWWLGFIDANDRAFIEIPADRNACAERDALVRKAGGAPGTMVMSQIPVARELPAAARLTFGVVDLEGRNSERVLTRVAAIVREDEAARPMLSPACWYFAQAGAEAAGYRVVEDRFAIAVHPPRPVRLRAVEASWKAYGDLADKPGVDSRFAPGADMPPTLRRRAAALMPGANQFHAQPFSAVVDPHRGSETFWLVGAIEHPEGAAGDLDAYNTLNLIVRPDDDGAIAEPLYRAGPSGGVGRDRAGSFAAQVVATIDLDGDGVDELLVRARYYSGGNLFVLKWSGTRFVAVRQGGYEGE